MTAKIDVTDGVKLVRHEGGAVGILLAADPADDWTEYPLERHLAEDIADFLVPVSPRGKIRAGLVERELRAAQDEMRICKDDASRLSVKYHQVLEELAQVHRQRSVAEVAFSKELHAERDHWRSEAQRQMDATVRLRIEAESCRDRLDDAQHQIEALESKLKEHKDD